MKKIKKYITKNAYNILIVIILIGATIMRLFFFNAIKTIGWDESVYLTRAKSIAFNLPDTTWGAHRHPLMPIIWGGLFKIHDSEFLPRVSLLLFSILAIYLSFLLASKLFDKKVGLIAALLLSYFSLHAFLTVQFLTDVPSLTFILLAFWLFIKATKEKSINTYKFILIGIILGIAFLTRFPAGMAFIIICLFQLFFYRFKLNKQKGTLLITIAFLLTITPFLIYSHLSYGNPLEPFIALLKMGTGNNYNVFFDIIKEYFYQFILLLLPLFIGLFSILFSKKQSYHKIYIYFILVWISLITIYFGFFVNHFEARYVLCVYPFYFMIISVGFLKIFDFLKQINRKIAYLAILSFFIVSFVYNLVQMQGIKKFNKYAAIERDVGLWLKKNSQKNDATFNAKAPQGLYYSGMAIYMYPPTEYEFLKQIEEVNPRFMVIFQPEVKRQYQYIYSFLETHNHHIATTLTDSAQNRTAIIYELEKND